MTRSPLEGLDKGRIVDKGIVGRYRQAITQDTFFRISRELFWVGTRPGVVSKQGSMQQCNANVTDRFSFSYLIYD